MADKMTINQALVMRKSLIERRNQLKELVDSVSKTKFSLYGEKETKEEAAFNIQDTDTMKTAIDLALFDIDSAIKQANAKAMIELPQGFDFRALMTPIKNK
jgi:molecular chaperone DnaK (HSP70)